jgi:UDPglucose 6-dehydrogenase
VDLISRILDKGGSVRAFDPVAMIAAVPALPKVYFASDPYDAAKGADLLLIMTEWNEFRELDLPRLRGLLNAPVIVDARNVYPLDKMRDAGFRYLSVGRRSVGGD